MACRQRKYTFVAIAIARAPAIKIWRVEGAFGDACPVGHYCRTHFAVDDYAVSIAGSGISWEDFPRGVPGFADMISLLRGYGVT